MRLRCILTAKSRAVRWDGKLYSLYDDRFYTEPPEHTWSSKRFKLPAGAEEITLTGADARAVGLLATPPWQTRRGTTSALASSFGTKPISA